MLFVLGWFAHAWHESTAHHEICADHGELVDVSAAPECSVASHQGLGHNGVELTATHPNDAHHEHCAFVALTQPTVSLDACSFAPVAWETSPLDRAPEDVARSRDERRFLLAPKQSPPRSGHSRV